MSYDIYLEVDTGGPEPASIDAGDWNMTSNLVPMWSTAGADLATFHGRCAGDCTPELENAIRSLEGDPEKYKAMNPPNGWGDYEGCVDFLRSLLIGFTSHPKAIVSVCR